MGQIGDNGQPRDITRPHGMNTHRGGGLTKRHKDAVGTRYHALHEL